MLIYQKILGGGGEVGDYKRKPIFRFNHSCDQHVKRSTSKKVLSSKNIKFLKSLGLEVKKQIK